MDSDQGKLFIGGISWETTEDKLNDYFGKYGELLQTVVMRDKMTGKPRGFGFVVFADPSIVDRVLQDTHIIDGRSVEAKRAMSREEQHTIARSGNSNMPRNAGSGGGGGGGGGGNFRTKKIFVGGLPPTLSEMEFREYFEAFGVVTDVVVMYDQSTQRPRGFGFVSFDSEDSVDRVVQKQYHDVGGKAVEVKRALPKDSNPSGSGNRSGGGGSYQSYSGSGANASSYDNRMDAGRYMQSAGSGANYNPYGSSGYSAPAYGYGAAASSVGYGGGHGGGYGSNGAYGNPSDPSSGAPRSPWNSQVPTGYGSAGYGANAGYGGAASWNTPSSGGPGSGHSGQSPGYGNQGYGYGGSEGLYGNQAGYGAAGGRGGGGLAGNSIGGHGEQGVGAGFMSGGYSDGSGGVGYSNTWRVDPAQGGGYGTGGQVNAPGGAIGYGGGYGASQSRQSQQQ